MLVITADEDNDIILDLGDGREVRVAFKGSKRMGEGRIVGKIGVHAPHSVKIHFPKRKVAGNVCED